MENSVNVWEVQWYALIHRKDKPCLQIELLFMEIKNAVRRTTSGFIVTHCFQGRPTTFYKFSKFISSLVLTVLYVCFAGVFMYPWPEFWMWRSPSFLLCLNIFISPSCLCPLHPLHFLSSCGIIGKVACVPNTIP
jgi:hypothetical protein